MSPNECPGYNWPADLDASLKNLHLASSCRDITAVMVLGARAGIPPEALYKLVQVVADQTKLDPQTLADEMSSITGIEDQSGSDPALTLARHVLRNHYDYTALRLLPDGRFMRFHQGVWREASDALLKKHILQSLRSICPDQKATLMSRARQCIEGLVGSEIDLEKLSLERRSVINCQNGEVWIRPDGSPDLRPHRRESLLTHILAIKYDPAAKCPKFVSALEEIFEPSNEPKDMIRHLFEFIGYAIQPCRDMACFWLLIGDGSNGKSSVMQTLQQVIGPGGVLNGQIDKFQRDNFAMASLEGKLVFIDDDLAENTKLSDGLLKKLSEGKDITARHAYGRRPTNFQSLALPVMLGNCYPATDDLSHGMWRRAQVIPFDRTFSKSQINVNLFPEIWQEELPGILNLALNGLKRLRERGHFDPPKRCLDALQEFKAHSNPLVAFIEDRCEKVHDSSLDLREFRLQLKGWVAEQGVRCKSDDKGLIRKLSALGFQTKKSQGYPRVHGIRLKAPK